MFQFPVDDKLYDKEDEKKEREEEQKRIQIEKEKIREIERKRHVRPWDKSKKFTTHSSSDESDSYDNRDWEPRKEYQPMSQEQWNEKQRIERKQEFAPKYETFVRPKENDVIEQNNDYYDDRDGSLILENERIEKSLFFTTKSKTFKRRNVEVVEDTMKDDDVISNTNEASSSKSFRSSEPPPTKTIESSIAAGLKFLRKQSDKDVLPKNKNKWCSTNEYN